MKPRMLLIASFTAVLSAGAFAQSGGGLPPITDKTPIYGSQIMTQQERLEYRSQMGAAKTLEEREQVRTRHHEQMVERAKERGITLPAEPPARVADLACGLGRSAVAMARGYPLIRVDGIDLDEASIARANELLGMRAQDLDWGDQRIRVIRKGTRAEQWLPASPESFMWLRLYLAELVHPLAPDDVLWWTLRRRDHGAGLARQPMNYEAQRAVFRRVNRLLGTHWSMHDLRHTVPTVASAGRSKRLQKY